MSEENASSSENHESVRYAEWLRQYPTMYDSGAPTTPPLDEPPPIDEPPHRPAIVSASSEADERIGHDIGDVLAASKRLDGKHLLVEIVDGEVFLHGTVADQIVRTEVEQLASSVPGVGRIHNELDVRN